MTFLEIANLDLLGKRIYLRKRDKYIKIFISGVVVHNDEKYFITKQSAINNENESVVRQVKVSTIVNGLENGTYVTSVPNNANIVDSKILNSKRNSFYKEGYSDGESNHSSISYGGCGHFYSSCGRGCGY